MHIISTGYLTVDSTSLAIFEFHEADGASVALMNRLAVAVCLLGIYWYNRWCMGEDLAQLARQIGLLPIVSGA
jgi:hypothetical protein